MSTSVEFRSPLPEITASVEFRSPLPEIHLQSIDNEDEECRTPTSSEYKIPVIETCPPAPRKQPRKVMLCKRKLWSEMQFFETSIVGRDEIDSFFKCSYNNIKKRPCTNTNT
ncbi:cyclin-dependent protein kinase inhibitor SMR1-like [Thalictrum thalictroides]|uniref:Cyclin-dependent protein kinase inhibitor SMR1-like n=1 Tax=Thalictrum thalictroides TaxID=46969 RepID=A0A7J6WTB1_THATH|nr:cyclin-dependent protein kinase inhibitor SMR1-like [Thalictrum thalictroides]